jgi:hypothetical protein
MDGGCIAVCIASDANYGIFDPYHRFVIDLLQKLRLDAIVYVLRTTFDQNERALDIHQPVYQRALPLL